LPAPSIGAVVAYLKGRDKNDKRPLASVPYVVLTRANNRFSPAGYLGNQYKPLETGGSPAESRFVVEGVVSANVSDERQAARREFLAKMDTLGTVMQGNANVIDMQQCKTEAYEMILGKGREAFDLNKEKPEVREAYGKNDFGASCLCSRRLIENGVKFVHINFPGFDNHAQIKLALNVKLPQIDMGVSSLLKDLSDRGLLDSTIVWINTEFGRHPKLDHFVPFLEGRGHWGNVFSNLIAGGGLKGGQVVGKSDKHGGEVDERPIHPRDIIASIYELMGIALNTPLPNPVGLQTYVLPQDKEFHKLTEIM
jgi:uncharacterized protein (DUF1501 family)